MLANCNGVLDLDYDLTLTNPGGFFERQFGADQQGVLQVASFLRPTPPLPPPPSKKMQQHSSFRNFLRFQQVIIFLTISCAVFSALWCKRLYEQASATGISKRVCRNVYVRQVLRGSSRFHPALKLFCVALGLNLFGLVFQVIIYGVLGFVFLS